MGNTFAPDPTVLVCVATVFSLAYERGDAVMKSHHLRFGCVALAISPG
jgi:hypothetical protein